MTAIIITGLDELGVTANQIAQLHQKLNGDLTPLMEAIGSVLENNTRDRFDTKLSPNGEYWANLMPSTIAQKGNDKILDDSNDLKKSIAWHANKDSVSVGTPEPYGVFHQFGTSPYVIRPKHKKALAFGGGVYKQVQHTGLSARPFLGVSDDDKQDIFDAINYYLTGN